MAGRERAYDLVIRGGTVFDGSGGPGREADVAVKDGRIAAVGAVSGSGAEEIEARGRIVTPGFVDIHTHYDGQVTWDSRLTPSAWHGVTTAVMGNCGVGFAPCRPEDHDRLIRLMEGVEDIPHPVLAEGLPWNWESYPDYLQSLSGRAYDIDVGAQLPHAALRVYVMGERGANREPASPADIAAMAALAKRAMEAGALGFSTSRTLNHRTSDGQPTPTLTAAEDELMGIAMGLKAAGRGVLQFVSDFADPKAEFGLMRRLVEASGRPLSFSLLQGPKAPNAWRDLLAALSSATADGLPMRAQVCGRGVGVLLGFELTLNPFSHTEAWKSVAGLPFEQRMARLAEASFRAALLDDAVPPGGAAIASRLTRDWDNMFLMAETPDYEPRREDSIAALARARGVAPEAVALEHMMTRGGRGMLYLPFLNYADGGLDPAYDMLRHPDCVAGLSDGGAHVGMICDGSFPTTNLTLWARDRTRGLRLPLEHMIRLQTRATAETVGLLDRGLVAPGLRADLNVIDFDRLAVEPPTVGYDLPGGGRRLLQRARGYVATLVAGQVTYRDGEPTGALPGRLVRGAQDAPAALAAE